MKKINILFVLGLMLALVATTFAQFETSLHKTRNGKPTWYNSENEGFETLTNVPVEELGCVECHDANDANGDPYPATGYTPDCVDCHATNSGNTVTQNDCLGCHSREASIINNPNYTDVHRTAGMVCFDCHGNTDMHGDGNSYNSMFDPGALTTDCQQTGCHESVPTNSEHSMHISNIHCTSCHAQTSLACYNCHFESQVTAHVKRAYKQITGFTILVNREKDGKVHPATFQSLSYDGNTWIAMGPSSTHTIVKEGARTCIDCHQNQGGNIPAIIDYNDDGIIEFAKWNSSDSTLSWLNGIVPLPLDYIRSFKLDFITYNGNPSDPPGPSKNWSFVKDIADGFQLLYATPLTKQQMNALGFDTTLVGVEKADNKIPNSFGLDQNYPNPFNPVTNIKYSVPERSYVDLVIYDAIGNKIKTLVSREQEAGVFNVEFIADNLSSGIYIYQLKAGDFIMTKKMILLK